MKLHMHDDHYPYTEPADKSWILFFDKGVPFAWFKREADHSIRYGRTDTAFLQQIAAENKELAALLRALKS